MKTIHKYPLPLNSDGRNTLDMPSDSTIIKTALQHGIATIWARVDTDRPIVKRGFLFVGTGYEIPNPLVSAYIDTFMFVGGDLVLHLFEVLPS